MMGDQPADLFDRVLLPVASEADARRVRDTILPYLAGTGASVIVVHVIKTTEGGIDPSPVDLQEEQAERLFEMVARGREGEPVETHKAYGDDIAEALLETARDTGASVVVVSPRAKSLLLRVLTGDTARSLMTNREIPVLAVPHAQE